MEIKFDRRIEIAAPASFTDAVRRAADARSMTVADFARQALSREMTRVKVDHPHLPALTGRKLEGKF